MYFSHEVFLFLWKYVEMNYQKIIQSKIFLNFAEVSEQIARWKNSREKIVFTNGCFDLVHRGHIESLAISAGKGSKLIIGLNTDSSVTLLKGAGRPLIDQESRAFMLAALTFVDAVVLFEEETPYGLIKNILPDVLVKGNDYKIEEIAGHDVVLANGGEVQAIDLLPGYSTSSLISKIKLLK